MRAKKDDNQFVATFRVVEMVEVDVQADSLEEALQKAKERYRRPTDLIDLPEGVTNADGGIRLISVTNIGKWDPEA